MYIITVTVCYSPEGAVDDSLFSNYKFIQCPSCKGYAPVTVALHWHYILRGLFLGRMRKRLHDEGFYLVGQFGVIGNALFGHVATLSQLGITITEP